VRPLLDLRMSWTGLKALARHLGWLSALALGLRAQFVRPFKGLPKAQTPKDTGSRKQLGPVLQLYRVLRARLGPERSLEILGSVVTDATLVWLDAVVGPVDPSEYQSMDEGARRAYLEQFAGRFPNADAQADKVTDTGFVHRVTRCRFVELCQALEVPEIAPLLCAGDLKYFADGPLDLHRPTTLAQGDPHCAFHFEVKDPKN